MSAALLSKIRKMTAQASELLVVQSRPIGGATSEEVERTQEMARYQGKPSLYAKEKLGLDLWSKMAAILDEVEKAPYRTNVKSGHKVGKTNSCAAFINYWFDVYDPGVVITTGASYDAMKDTVWSEVRMQRTRANLPDFFIGPVAPEMRTSPDHWAKLFSVNQSTAFQGKHRGRMCFLFDEAVGVERAMFTVAETMFKSEPGFAWLCFCNPTDPSSQIYAEEQLLRAGGIPKWRTYSISSLDHPNIVAQREAREKRGVELSSKDLPIPNAVSISQVDDWVQDWCLPIDPLSREATDFEWTFADGRKGWFRPQMDWEARCEGKWPSSATTSVWSDALFQKIVEATGTIPLHLLPELGGDVGRFGDDKSCIHTRWGPLSLTHGSRQGLRTTEMTGWVIETATELAKLVNQLREKERAGRPICTPQEIPLKIDDDGVGGGVTDELFEQGFNVIPVNGQSIPAEPARYLNKRSELWFQNVRRAIVGGVAFCSIGSDGKVYSRLDKDAVARLKLQAMAPKWKMAGKGQRVVEKKEETKKRLGHSPDDMDAMNLAYYEANWEAPIVIANPNYDERQLGPATPSPDAAWNDQLPPPQKSRRPRFGR